MARREARERHDARHESIRRLACEAARASARAAHSTGEKLVQENEDLHKEIDRLRCAKESAESAVNQLQRENAELRVTNNRLRPASRSGM
jgi:hypothetical protein